MNNQIISHLKVAICTVFFLHLYTMGLSQVPAGMNYQAVVRDVNGDILTNRNVGMRFSITNSQAGELLYQERHQVTSNQFGLVSLTIGTGIPTSGLFDEISWRSVAPWLRVEMDPNGGTAYVDMGSSRLMSVPYAFYSESSKHELPDGSAPGNTIYWNGFSWVVNSSNIYNNGADVGINTSSPLGKLHIRGSENVSQLIVDGSMEQSNNVPLFKLRRNNGLTLLSIHSDDPSNAFIGIEAGIHNTEGRDLTAVGSGALQDNTSGSRNTSIGVHSMFFNTTGSDNAAIGVDALVNNTQGDSNVAVGNFALNDNLIGSNNVAAGLAALNSNASGSHNTAAGTRALVRNTVGNNNTAIGFEALADNTIGSFRTAVGVNSNSAGAGFSNSTGLGYNAVCSAPNQVRIGNSEVTSIGGFADWTNVSDARFKRNVSENVVGLDFINALRPVTYTLDLHAIDDWWAENYQVRDPSLAVLGYEKERIVYTGFIAQEVEATAKSLGYEFSGIDSPKNETDHYGLRYGTFVVPLVKAVQEIVDRISGQQMQIEALKKENAENDQRWIEQQEQINMLKAVIDDLKSRN